MVIAAMSASGAPLPTKKAGVRRLSSAAARPEDVATGPVVVVPPEHLDFPGYGNETAVALEMARYNLNRASYRTSPAKMPPTTNVTGTYAFAFDIDGVLMRGGRPIPEAIEAMKVLNGQNEYGIKV